MSDLDRTSEGGVLIVDDTPANLLALQAVLQPIGVRLVEAASGKEAIERAQKEQFALMLLDVQMPEMDGFETAKAIRATDSGRETPIIFLTAIHRDERYARIGYEVGGADYLLKPFDPDVLRARVRSFVDLYNQREALRQKQMQARTGERDEALRRVEQLLEAEKAARHEAEVAASRQRFLAEVSAVLASSFDVDTTLSTVVKMTVPAFGDWCAIDGLDEDGGLVRLAVASADEPSSRLEAAAARIDVRRALASAGGIVGANEDGASMCIPLRRRQRSLGALSFFRSAAGPRYTTGDLSLGDEIALRVSMAIENAELYRSAQAAVQLREDFVSIASHELKTPLTSLKLQLASTRKRLPEDRKVLADRLATVDRQVDKITELVGRLLDVSRIAGGRLELDPQWIDLMQVVERVVERFATNAAGSSLRLNGEPMRAFLDPFRIEQIVTNLVANAVKYGKGNPIEVELTAEGDAARISVRDQGIGIGTKEQARIFGRFERAVSSRQFGGFGLGLWIARQVVEASGGSIRVSSEAGHGAEFTVMLPLNRAQPSQAAVMNG